MSAHINFEDNIFIITMKVRVIRDLLLLDADPDIFLDKTLEDIEFINHALDLILNALMNNNRYIERDEQFHNLSETEWKFTHVLTSLASGDSNFTAQELPGIREKVSAIRAQAAERRKTLETLFINNVNKPLAEPVVSVDELSELLKELK
ncbi:MAG: hypothetical protein LBD37_01745 [Treponema sp.]|jgi:hypothetical protein|nr:hypothetical protein [Treponema sp.]